MSDTTLKPCPFCGAAAAYTEHEKTNETRGWCPRGCGAEGPFGALSLGPGWGDAMARDGWNTRPIEDALRARAEAAEAALATARAEVDAAFQQGLTAGQVATCGALSAIAAEVDSAGLDETATAIRIAAATLIKADLRLERGPVEGA